MSQHSRSRLAAILIASLTLPGCSAAAPSRGEPPPHEAGAPGRDLDDLVTALRVRNARVDSAEVITLPALEREGRKLLLNGRTLQVFEYGTVEEARTASALVSPDGAAVNEVPMAWSAPPHWFQHGRLLVLYLGSDRITLLLLQDVLGHQMAGANGLPAG